MITITSVRIKKNKKQDDQLLGTASILLDNCLVIHNIKLLQIKDRRVASFPNRKVKKFNINENGYEEVYEYSDIVHPANKEFRDYIEAELFKVYDMEVDEVNE